MSMCLMLVVLVVFIRYAADPSNWAWVDRLDGDAWAGADDAEQPADTPLPKASRAKPAPQKPASKPETGKPSPKPEAGKPSPAPQPAPVVEAEPAEPPGLTDEDPEEADSASEELQAVGDRTLYNQPEEMLAYDRLVKWSRNQSFEAMAKRAKRRVVFNDFIQSPDKWRGKLVALDLMACRVLKYEQKPGDNPRYANLYEVWGFTNESRNWLYEAVVVDPPPELPKGPSVQEKVRLVGYFFKVQAYQPAGAKPNQQPLFAPVFIGRLTWAKPVVPRVQSADYLWFGLMAGIFGLIMIAAVGTLFLRRRRRNASPSIVIGTSGLTTDEWLDRAEVGEAPLDGDPSDDGQGGGEPSRTDPQDDNVERAQ